MTEFETKTILILCELAERAKALSFNLENIDVDLENINKELIKINESSVKQDRSVRRNGDTLCEIVKESRETSYETKKTLTSIDKQLQSLNTHAADISHTVKK